MPLSDIVNVQITRQTAAVSRAGFGTLLVVGAHKRFNDRVKFYSTLTAMADDFEATDKEYIAASDFFGQSPTPTQIAVGRRKVDDPVGVAVSDVENDTDYDIYINGTKFSFTSDSDATAAEIAAGLVAAVNAGSEPVTATDDADGTFTLSADVSGTAYTLKIDSKCTQEAFTITETIGTTMNAIVDESDAWYGIVLTDRTQATVELMAAWAETRTKVFGTASADANIPDTTAAADATTIAATLKAASYARTFVFYHSLAATEFIDAALFGKILTQDPGSYTAKFKTLSSVSVDTLTDTQVTNIRAKNCNYYTEVGGVNITQEGVVSEPEFIDVIIFVDWLQSDMTSNIFSKLVNLPKVPFTDSGIGVVEAEVRASLNRGIDRGGLADDPAPVISVPKAADVSTVDKAARTLPDVTFSATLAGAIHKVEVSGTVSL